MTFAVHLAALGFRDAPLLGGDADAANALPPEVGSAAGPFRLAARPSPWSRMGPCAPAC